MLSLCLMDTDLSLAATSDAFATGPWHELTLLNNNYAKLIGPLIAVELNEYQYSGPSGLSQALLLYI